MTHTLTQHNSRARAFVPGHITGIFRIFDDCKDPLYCGSKGAGFSIEAGTITTVALERGKPTEVHVKYNGQGIVAPVTSMVVSKMLYDYEEEAMACVEHTSQLPIGVGLAASGAGALGASIALGSLLDESLSLVQAGQYAHVAEVVNRTGLGDVIAQTVGGVEIRTHPGAPGIGKIQSVAVPTDRRVVIACGAGIETKHILSNQDSRVRINNVADRLLQDLMKHPTFENIVQISREFAESSGLMTPRVRNALTSLWDAGHRLCSMVMLGDSVFALCKESEVESVRHILRKYWNESEVMVTSISRHGGGLM